MSENGTTPQEAGMTGDDTLDLGNGFQVIRLAIDKVREQDLNAHTMPPRIFERLAENISQRGGMSSLPLVARPEDDGPYEVVSGHHRLRAAQSAGHNEAWVLVDSKLQTRSEIIAEQLAHNALIGNDDPSLVLELLKDVDNPDDLLHTGLADELPKMESESLALFTPHLDFQFKTVVFTFLPHQMRNFDDLLDKLKDQAHLMGAVPEDQFKTFLEATAKYARFKDVRSVGTAIALLTEKALAELEDVDTEDVTEDADKEVSAAQ